MLDYTDDVRGIIIGGECFVGGLFYEGRKQGRDLYADTEEELQALALELKREILADCGQVARDIYPADSWELRIYE